MIPAAGWLDGGCFCLAAALHTWADGRATAVGVFRSNADIMEHAAVALIIDGAKVIADGDGIKSEEQFAKTWQLELRDSRSQVRDVSFERIIGPALCDQVFDVEKLAQHLGANLGSPAAFRMKEAGEVTRRDTGRPTTLQTDFGR